MKTLGQFKAENGISQLGFVKANEGKHAFTNHNDMNIILSNTFDPTKEAFVMPLTKDKQGNAIEGKVFVVCNLQKAQLIATL